MNTNLFLAEDDDEDIMFFTDIISEYVVNYFTFKKKDRQLFESLLLTLYDQALVFFT